MVDVASASRISTHYYKIAHLLLVTYAVYTAKEPSVDQFLLELELQIRNDHPKILLTYYNKSLFHFHFDHLSDKDGGEQSPKNDLDVPKESPIHLHLLYPQLILKHEFSVSAEQLANPSRIMKNTAKKDKDDLPDGHLAFASLSFLKAIKKALVYNLSASGNMVIFGNYVVARVLGTSSQYSIVQLDPVLLSNGDIIVSLSQRNKLALFDSSILNLDHVFLELASCFVIYVVPSGLRCHLYDTSSMQQSFTYTPPKSGNNLLRLLKLSTGVELNQTQPILWVKLIPNLQHLNNQTSRISRFVHDVDNKKYILWPWELCLLQFGSVEENPIPNNTPPGVDPLSLISDFIQFSVLRHENDIKHTEHESVTQIHPLTQPPFSMPSVFSTGMSTGGDVKMEHMNMLEVNPEVLDIFEIDNEDNLFGETGVLAVPLEEKEEVTKENEDDDSDLFGSSPGLDSKMKTPEKSTFLPEQESAVEVQSAEEFKPELFESAIKDEIQHFPEEPAFINIPRDQMISAPINMTPLSYDDPGAPPAIMPTPIIPQNPLNQFSSQYSMSTTPKIPQSHFPGRHPNPFGPKDGKEQGDENLAYVFSPILFNPMIKSNIDTKYGKGGKFYVERENSMGPEENFRVRETSVSGFETGKSIETAEKPDKDPHMESMVYEDITEKEHEGNEEEEEEEEEEDEEEDEESDVDEVPDINELKTSPLKLNTHSSDIFQLLKGGDNVAVAPASVNFQNTLVNNFLSPGSNLVKNTTTGAKIESPFGFGLGTVDAAMTSLSSPIVEHKQEIMHQMGRNDDTGMQIDSGNKDPGTAESANTPLSSSSSTNNGVSESSNCLPLILRNINVVSIPSGFILQNIPGAWGDVPIAAGFNMDVDEEEDDFENGGLSVKIKDLDECLKWLTPNIVYDLGLSNFEKRLHLKLPDFFSDEVVEDVTDGEISPEIRDMFVSTFPLSYRVTLNEFITEREEKPKSMSESQSELDNQLSFLDNITNDDILNPESSTKDLNTIYWDSLYPELKENQEQFGSYRELVNVSESQVDKKTDDSSVFSLNEVKAKVYKNGDDIVNLNFVGVKFWNYLNFSPVNGPKRFHVLLISEHDMRNTGTIDSIYLDFLDLLKNNYKEGQFGAIKKLNLQTSETRPDLEGINNGLMLVDKDIGDGAYRNFYKRVNKKLKSLAELIKLDLINKTNRFEFDRPLLLLFVNFDQSINSVLQISKICRNFKMFLNDHQLSLVNPFSHIVPWNYIIKQSDNRRRLRYLSNHKLARFSMTLYNKCPNNDNHDRIFSRDETRKLYTNLVREPPSALHFKFLNKHSKEGSSSTFHDDIFLHVAYERSVDRNWISAAWSDPLGIVTYTKSWYCSATAKSNGSDAHELGSLINEIWEISSTLFKKLSEDAIQRTCGSSNKNFLVLTRISSIIPDDELVFWKRLTTKHKDISLLVLSANRMPKYLFSSKITYSVPMETAESRTGGRVNFEDHQTPNFVTHGRNSMSSAINGADFFKSLNGVTGAMSPSPSGVGLIATSPMNNSLNFHSPQQFLNNHTNFLSPVDAGNANGINEADYLLKDPGLEILGVIPKMPLPSFNSPTRLGMRIGYLIREAKVDDTCGEVKYIVYEVTLLSCLSYWNLNAIMKILLNQYKKLIVLNEVMATSRRSRDHTDELRSLVPWHINAVVKTIDYLVHVNVDEQTKTL